jgi:ribosome-associated translation inhibitor RaiA
VTPILAGAANKPVVRERTERVYDAFDQLEDVLERELQRNAERESGRTEGSPAA